MGKKLSVNNLSDSQFEEIMDRVAQRTDIPHLKTEQVNMRLSPDVMRMAKRLAKKAGRPFSTFLAELVTEDLRRIWRVAK